MTPFPLIREGEAIPWWAGICWYRYEDRSCRCAPIGVNVVLALLNCLRYFLVRPVACLRFMDGRDEVRQLQAKCRALDQMNVDLIRAGRDREKAKP